MFPPRGDRNRTGKIGNGAENSRVLLRGSEEKKLARTLVSGTEVRDRLESLQALNT